MKLVRSDELKMRTVSGLANKNYCVVALQDLFFKHMTVFRKVIYDSLPIELMLFVREL
jgi:hypothetical protein